MFVFEFVFEFAVCLCCCLCLNLCLCLCLCFRRAARLLPDAARDKSPDRQEPKDTKVGGLRQKTGIRLRV